MKKTIRNLLALSATFLLAGCGGQDLGSAVYTDFYSAHIQAKEAAGFMMANPVFNEVKCEYTSYKTDEHVGFDKEVQECEVLIESDFDNQVVIHAKQHFQSKYTDEKDPTENSEFTVSFEAYLVYEEEKGVTAYVENFGENDKFYEQRVTVQQIEEQFEEMKQNYSVELIGREITKRDAAVYLMTQIISYEVDTGEGFAFGYDVYPIASVDLERQLSEKLVSPKYEVDFDKKNLSYEYTADESSTDETCLLKYSGKFVNNKFTYGLFDKTREEKDGDDVYKYTTKEEATLKWNENTIVLPDLSSYPAYVN